ncbi:tetratricopeptide repeat protein [Methylophilaceae bacterium]|nr:tetratricopeptide repeat protein [Methylophilaceae bacterium]
MNNKNINAALVIGIFLLFSPFAYSMQSNIEEIKLLLKNGEYVLAETLTNKSIEENLNDPELLFYKGIIETNMGKNNQAIDTFRNLTDRFPELPEPYNNLAVLYAEKGQFSLAKEILEQAIKTNPSYLTAHINLGDIFTKMASESYNKALEIDKSNNVAITKLSMITQLFNYQPNTKNTTIKVVKSKNDVNDEVLSKKDKEKYILVAIENWKRAWEDKNMDNYLNSYSPNFIYPNNMSKEEWEKYRTNRIVSKKIITISISNIKLRFKKEKVTATFKQNYKSGKLNQTSYKTLVLVGTRDQWLILEETSK